MGKFHEGSNTPQHFYIYTSISISFTAFVRLSLCQSLFTTYGTSTTQAHIQNTT